MITIFLPLSLGMRMGSRIRRKPMGSSLTGGSEDSAVAACGRRIPVKEHRANRT
ncbi:MAG: hypothetical protein IKA76_04970 [Clostridia bacterium]|nr:hypothetical protein [Clostridia bacterium]